MWKQTVNGIAPLGLFFGEQMDLAALACNAAIEINNIILGNDTGSKYIDKLQIYLSNISSQLPRR